jgi:hypothetical protein
MQPAVDDLLFVLRARGMPMPQDELARIVHERTKLSRQTISDALVNMVFRGDVVKEMGSIALPGKPDGALPDS